MSELNKKCSNGSLNIGLIVAGAFGFVGAALVALSTPFILPALRKHCLPYMPATDTQLKNLLHAFKKHTSLKGTGKFIDIGSGDGRICLLADKSGLFKQVDGVELNSILVLFSRLLALKRGQLQIKFHRCDLWKFPLNRYDTVCIFGVESMMKPLDEYIQENNLKGQRIYACRFPFTNRKPIDEIGDGIDTVWVYDVEPKIERHINRVKG